VDWKGAPDAKAKAAGPNPFPVKIAPCAIPPFGIRGSILLAAFSTAVIAGWAISGCAATTKAKAKKVASLFLFMLVNNLFNAVCSMVLSSFVKIAMAIR
jgi:hypothetical protein